MNLFNNLLISSCLPSMFAAIVQISYYFHTAQEYHSYNKKLYIDFIKILISKKNFPLRFLQNTDPLTRFYYCGDYLLLLLSTALLQCGGSDSKVIGRLPTRWNEDTRLIFWRLAEAS